MTPDFQTLIDIYVREDVPVRPQDPASPAVSWDLKVATVAQWMHESGRGESLLAEKHSNFGGLKWLDPNDGRTDPYATRVFEATPSEPQGEHWRAFAELMLWLNGYWQFIETGWYDDPMTYATDPDGYIRMLHQKGYATDPAYVTRVVDLFPEAEAQLYWSAERQGIDPDDSPDPPPGEQLFGLAIVVGHNHAKQGACSPYGIPCEWAWNDEIARLMEKRAANHGMVARVFYRQPGGNASTEIRRCYDTEVNPWSRDLEARGLQTLCIELHYNGGGGDGAEMLYWPGSVIGEGWARNLLEAVGTATGINTSRGIKATGSGAGSVSLSAARDPNVVWEPFFGDTRANVDTILAAGGQSTLADANLAAARKTAEEHGLVTERPPVEPPPAEPPPDVAPPADPGWVRLGELGPNDLVLVQGRKD